MTLVRSHGFTPTGSSMVAHMEQLLTQPHVARTQPSQAVKDSVKPLRTNLYGRLAMNEEQEQILITNNPPLDGTYKHLTNPKTGEQSANVFQHIANIDANYINPHLAAYITANQRIHLFEVMELIGVGNVYYADADMAAASKQDIDRVIDELPDGNGYGSWRKNGEYKWIKVNGPKDYYGEYTPEWAEEHGLEERRFGKAKGVPVDLLRQHPEYQETHEQFDINTRASFTKALLNPNDPVTLVQKRSSSTLASSQSWKEEEDHSIVPRTMNMKSMNRDGVPAVPTPQIGLKWMNDLGFSQSSLAELLGVSVKYIQSIMQGHRYGKKLLEQIQQLVEDADIIDDKIRVVA